METPDGGRRSTGAAPRAALLLFGFALSMTASYLFVRLHPSFFEAVPLAVIFAVGATLAGRAFHVADICRKKLGSNRKPGTGSGTRRPNLGR
jgi:hypothetical protein